MRIGVLLSLILCNLIWSANPVAGKVVMQEVSPELAAWLRYASAFLGYVVILGALRFLPKVSGKFGSGFLVPKGGSDWFWIFVIGFCGFCFSPLSQMIGLHASRAMDNSLIVAMEPMITVFLAALILRERVSFRYMGAFAVALSGFFLLTEMTPARFLSGSAITSDVHFFGNVLILVSLMGEGFYSIGGRKLLVRHLPVGIFGCALGLGVVFLTAAAFFFAGPSAFAGLATLSWKGWLAVFWLGPLGTALTYLYWMIALTEASVAAMALTLFVQPVSGSLWGYWFLEERLTVTQIFGAGLILVAVVLQGVRK